MKREFLMRRHWCLVYASAHKWYDNEMKHLILASTKWISGAGSSIQLLHIFSLPDIVVLIVPARRAHVIEVDRRWTNDSVENCIHPQ